MGTARRDILQLGHDNDRRSSRNRGPFSDNRGRIRCLTVARILGHLGIRRHRACGDLRFRIAIVGATKQGNASLPDIARPDQMSP